MSKVLIVLTSHTELGDTGKKTGFHFEEFTTPYYRFLDSNIQVDIASIKGGKPLFDPNSLDSVDSKRPDSIRRFLRDSEAQLQLENTISVHQVNIDQYDAIYLAGGHGTMWDFPDSQGLINVLAEMYENKKIISAICHGPAGLINVRRESDNMPIVQGKNINCFSDAEERDIGLDKVVPFLLQSKLESLGANYQKGKPEDGFVVQDGIFITGQNPNSLKSLCDKVIKAIEHSSSLAA